MFLSNVGDFDFGNFCIKIETFDENIHVEDTSLQSKQIMKTCTFC